MCTLSWWINDQQRGLFFNRDENRNRPRSMAPQIIERTTDSQPCKILIPTDPQAGGTWIGVNQHGLILALLNHYPENQISHPGNLSRGLLVIDLLTNHASPAACFTELTQIDLKQRRGFVLFAMNLQDKPMIASWDGSQLSAPALPKPPRPHYLTSSSFQPEACLAYREQLFSQADSPVSPAQLKTLHHHYDPAAPAYSPLMQRPDSATESITEIVIDKKNAHMTFQPIQGTPPIPQTTTHKELPLSPPTHN